MMEDVTRRADAGENVLRKAAAFKVFASEMCGRVVDACVQVYGGAGYLAEYDAERFFRDARIYRIYEGTTQILPLQIAKHMLRDFHASARMYNLLSGLSVIEASSFVASPTAGLYCAQMGAEVIRVDQIGGGPDFRRWPVTATNDSLYWENLNRAKKSVALDLGRPEGRELLQELVRATGQFITNFPVGGFLSHDTLAKGRADLITVRVMGWADGSPALDYTVNNSVGYPMLTGAGPEPVNHVLPAWDLLTGAYAAFALLSALQRRGAPGEGGEIRLPLSDIANGTAANMGGLAVVLYTGQHPPHPGHV